MLKRLYKRAIGRVLRGGLTGVNERLERIERLATADRSALAVWRGDLRTGVAVGPEGEPNPDATSRLRAELADWVRKRKQPEEPGCDRRLSHLREALGVSPDEFDAWAGERVAVELCGGPRPLIGDLPWKQAIAIDPLCEGYDTEGLWDPSQGLVRICAPVSALPLVARSADLVVCENLLDRVAEPASLLEAARALLAEGGRLWIGADLANRADAPCLDRSQLDRLVAQCGLRTVWRLADQPADQPEQPNTVALLCELDETPGQPTE